MPHRTSCILNCIMYHVILGLLCIEQNLLSWIHIYLLCDLIVIRSQAFFLQLKSLTISFLCLYSLETWCGLLQSMMCISCLTTLSCTGHHYPTTCLRSLTFRDMWHPPRYCEIKLISLHSQVYWTAGLVVLIALIYC